MHSIPLQEKENQNSNLNPAVSELKFAEPRTDLFRTHSTTLSLAIICTLSIQWLSQQEKYQQNQCYGSYNIMFGNHISAHQRFIVWSKNLWIIENRLDGKKRKKILACTCLIVLDKLRRQKQHRAAYLDTGLENDISKKYTTKKVPLSGIKDACLNSIFSSSVFYVMSLLLQSLPLILFCQVAIALIYRPCCFTSRIWKCLIAMASRKHLLSQSQITMNVSPILKIQLRIQIAHTNQ